MGISGPAANFWSLMKILKQIFYASFASFIVMATESKAQLLDSSLRSEVHENTRLFAEGRFNREMEPSALIAGIIKAFLGLLGVIFIILIIYAGFTWMTAGGEEEKVRKSKEIIKRSIIGLAIIIAAYAITAFVFKSLPGGGGIEMGE